MCDDNHVSNKDGPHILKLSSDSLLYHRPWHITICMLIAMVNWLATVLSDDLTEQKILLV